MPKQGTDALLVWIFQTGEPLHIDGGAARPMRAMNLSNALVDAGHQVVLWSAAFYHQEKRHRSASYQQIRVSEKLDIRLIPSRGYQRHIGIGRLVDHAQLALNLKRALRHAGPLPDVAFIGYPPIEAAAVLTQWLGHRGIPSLLDLKDQWPALFLEAVPRPLRGVGRVALWPYFYLASRAMRDAAGLSSMANGFLQWALGVAQRERSQFDGVFPLTPPIGTVSEAQLREARQWWDAKGLLNDGRPRICYVGSHMRVLDFRPVEEAAIASVNARLPWEFIICGDGGSSAELRATMSNLPNVHFPGWVDRPKIEALAERCQGALAPYLNIENFTQNVPNKIIDALSLGLPILTPLHGEVAKLIFEHNVGMRYGTDTGRTLYDCIQEMAHNPLLQKAMSEKARSLYIRQFSFDSVYGSLVRHLEKLANSKASKSER